MKSLMRQMLAGRAAPSRRPQGQRKRQRKGVYLELLESRRMLATLSNMPGEATLEVDVDAFGSFGSDIMDLQVITGDAFYDPLGPVGPRGTTFESAVAIELEPNPPVFLSCGRVGDNPPLVNPATGFCFTTMRDSATQVTSNFAVGGLPGLFFILTQQLLDFDDPVTGNRIGSYLRQEYEINNTTNGPLTFDIYRYYDANLRFNGTIAVDGGGRDVTNLGQVLVTTDDATGRLQDVGDLAAILSVGDVIDPAASFFEISPYDSILQKLTTAVGLNDQVTGDTTNDDIIDNGRGYNVTTGLRHRMVLASNETKTYTTFTFFGAYKLSESEFEGAVIQGMKFEDFNGNGSFDTGEQGLAGVQIFVDLNNNGTPDAGEPSTTTGSSGQYAIDGLVPGTYTVAEVVPNNFTQTSPAGGTYTVTISMADQVVSGIDFGNRSTLATVTGMKFADLNGNGAMDAGDYPLSGWTIFSDLNGNGALTQGEPFGVTGDDGVYVFRVNEGSNTITEVQQPNWQPTTPAGGRVTVDIAAQEVRTVNFGNDPDPATIQGVKFSDENANGQQDPGEAGLPGFVIYLDCNGGTLICDDNGSLDPTEPSVTTGPDGSYRFNDLPPGSYLVREVPLPGWEQTFPTNNGSHSVTLDAGDVAAGINFGNRAQDGAVSGFKYNDLNGNGVRDPQEPGLPGFYIYADIDEDMQWGLGEPGGITGEFGAYAVPGLRPGIYTIRERPRPGWVQTDPSGDEGHRVVVGPGEILSGFNFGNHLASDFGDAPDPYPTLIDDNGPSHGSLAGYRLGGLWDGEVNGIPQADALGDDLTDLDDEDGVLFLTEMGPGESATIQVTVATGNQPSGFLQGWIDFNANGSWDDLGEQVFRDLFLGPGQHELSINVPVSAAVGETFARFRYASSAGISYTGPATTGEVEDYQVVILGDEPQANNDEYQVVLNSDQNELDVLANDYPSYGTPTGELFIIDLTQPLHGVAVVDDRGTETDPSDDVVLYTPNPGFQGTDLFTYTIVDDFDRTDSATVSVLVDLPTDPIAVDDTFFVAADNLAHVLDVMANDLTGENPPISIASFSSPSHGGLTLGANNTNLVYTPAAGFSGVDQFEYLIRDVNGVTSEPAIVTVHVGDTSSDKDMSIRFEMLDSTGNVLPRNSEIPVGSVFTVRTYIRDLRPVGSSIEVDSPADLGIFSSYFDLLYNALNVSFVDNSIEFGANYSAGRNQDSSIPGIIDEVGALQSEGSMPLGPGEQLLVSMDFRADRIGETQIYSDPADILPLHETLFNHPEVPADLEQIQFGFTSIRVVAAQKLIGVQLQVTDLADRVISTVPVGDDFKLQVYVQDLRPGLIPHGVFSAYTDVAFNPTIVSLVESMDNATGLDITFGDDFGAGQNAEFAVGILEEAGAFQGLNAEVLGPDPVLLFEVTMHAESLGGVVFRADQAELPEHEMLLIDSTATVPPSQVNYGNAVLSVVSSTPPFQNQQNALDVNDDKAVSPMDALLVINKLNRDGAGPLGFEAEGETGAPTFYYDVNGNYSLEPADVLAVINYLNSVNGVTGLGEGEAESAAMGFAAESKFKTRQNDSPNHNRVIEQSLTEGEASLWLPNATRRDEDGLIPREDKDWENAEPINLEAVLAAIASDVDQQWRRN